VNSKQFIINIQNQLMPHTSALAKYMAINHSPLHHFSHTSITLSHSAVNTT